MNDPEKSSSLFLFLIGLFVLVGSVRLGLGTVSSPGPGFLPFWAAIILLLSSVLYLFSKVFSRNRGLTWTLLKDLWAGTKWQKIVYVVIALLAYTLLFEAAGFILCTLFLMTFLLLLMETKRWQVILIGGLLITAASYMIFEKLLAVGFPKGVLGF